MAWHGAARRGMTVWHEQLIVPHMQSCMHASKQLFGLRQPHRAPAGAHTLLALARALALAHGAAARAAGGGVEHLVADHHEASAVAPLALLLAAATATAAGRGLARLRMHRQRARAHAQTLDRAGT